MPETMTRPLPTAEEIAALFQKWGIEPQPSCFLRNTGDLKWHDQEVICERPCGCADGALLAEVCGGIENALLARNREPGAGGGVPEALHSKTGWPLQFIEGVSSGFTAGSQGYTVDFRKYPSPERTHGFQAGLGAWNLLQAQKEASP